MNLPRAAGVNCPLLLCVLERLCDKFRLLNVNCASIFTLPERDAWMSWHFWKSSIMRYTRWKFGLSSLCPPSSKRTNKIHNYEHSVPFHVFHWNLISTQSTFSLKEIVLLIVTDYTRELMYRGLQAPRGKKLLYSQWECENWVNKLHCFKTNARNL